MLHEGILAPRSDTVKVTPYLYLENKESLLIAILERLSFGAVRRLDYPAADEPKAEQMVLRFTEDAIRGYLGMPRMTPSSPSSSRSPSATGSLRRR